MTDGQKERLFTAVVVLWDFLDRFKSNRWLSLDDPSELRKFYLRLLSLIIAVLLAVTTGFLWVVFRVYFELYQYSIFYEIIDTILIIIMLSAVSWLGVFTIVLTIHIPDFLRLVLWTVEYFVRRIAEYPKGPILALSALSAAAAGLLKGIK
jgi:hypothetical protein